MSVAHLADEERMLVLSLVLEQTLAWVRGLPGTTDLRALVLFDEVFGYLPPHPANPPTKRPLLSLLKQARAFGVGCVVATQNPIDLDYKAHSNAGMWFIGRLQTDADRERVIEGMTGSDAASADPLDRGELAQIVKSLPPRTFFVRDVHAKTPSQLLETRWTLSWLRGPMTRQEIKRWSKANGPAAPPMPTPSVAPAPTPTASAPPTTPPAPIAAPDGWRTLYPAPPMAPLEAWYYAPYVGIVAQAEIADARLGFRATRRIALIAQLRLPGGRADQADQRRGGAGPLTASPEDRTPPPWGARSDGALLDRALSDGTTAIDTGSAVAAAQAGGVDARAAGAETMTYAGPRRTRAD